MLLTRLVLAFALIAQLGASYRCCPQAELCATGKCCGDARPACCPVQGNNRSGPSCCPIPEQLDRSSCECCARSVPSSRDPVEALPTSVEEVTSTLHLLTLPGPMLGELPRSVEPPNQIVMRPPRGSPTGRRLAMACVWRE